MSPSAAPNGRNATNSEHNEANDKEEAKSEQHRTSLVQKAKALWSKTGIDARTYKNMFKGAIAPTIAISLYQLTSYAETFTTVGYLVGIATILSVVIRPRAVFLQTMLLNVIFLCFTCAVVVLALFCCVKARQNTEDTSTTKTGGSGTSGLATAGASTSTYNSSASAVAGVWLVVLVYILAVLRALKPQFMVPAILGSIVANIGLIYAAQFATMTTAEVFIRKLLITLLTGFAIATGVSLLIFPVTSRTVIFADMKSYITSLRTALQANMDYVHSLEETDMFTARRTDTARHRVERSPEAQAVKAKMRALAGVAAKFSSDLPFAKREVAIGYLGPDDIQQIGKHLRLLMIPMAGLSCLSDIFERIAEDRGWASDYVGDSAGIASTSPNNADAKLQSITEWHQLTKMLREPFQDYTNVIDNGLEHAMKLLRLTPDSKESRRAADIEAKGSDIRPGQEGYAALLAQRTGDFHEKKQSMLRGWCKLRGVELPPDFFSGSSSSDFEDPEWFKLDFDSDLRVRSRRQLYLCLYMEFLLWSIGQRTVDLISFIEQLKTHGKLDKKRLVLPGSKRLRKWVRSLFQHDEDTHQDHQIEGNDAVASVYLGSAYSKKRDPMHLPPANKWERFGDYIRSVAQFLASPSSVFGFRVACATMCIAVVAYLKDTQVFYTEHRIFWAQIMVSIGMQPTAGQSLRTSLFRIIGTGIFMLVAWICWYIVDGKTAGVLVFYFLFLHLGPWIIMKHPGLTTLGMIGPITMTLILGYELQVRKIGVTTSESNGQLYYPVYELGPIRLATVLGGLFLGWIWTIFPFPISEHAEQKKSLGSALYLLANYYSVMHETVRARLRGLDHDHQEKGTPGYRLEKARRKIFAKCGLLITSMRTRSAFISFDIPVGGKFPKQQYDEIIDLLQSSLSFMALVSHASISFNELQHNRGEDSNSAWLRDFRKLVGDANVTSQSITTLLSLMSAAVSNSQALPPYLRVPEPYQLSTKMDELDRDILSIKHIAEPGYASFAVIQIGTKLILDDLKKLLPAIKELVGELDFSFHVVSTADSSNSESEVTLTMRKDQGESLSAYNSKQD